MTQARPSKYNSEGRARLAPHDGIAGQDPVGVRHNQGQEPTRSKGQGARGTRTVFICWQNCSRPPFLPVRRSLRQADLLKGGDADPERGTDVVPRRGKEMPRQIVGIAFDVLIQKYPEQRLTLPSARRVFSAGAHGAPQAKVHRRRASMPAAERACGRDTP
jgi:hypothetical protein